MLDKYIAISSLSFKIISKLLLMDILSSSSSMSSSSVTSTTSSSTSSSRGLTSSVDQSLLSLSGDKTDAYSRPGGGRKHRPGLGGYIPNFPTIEESSLE